MKNRFTNMLYAFLLDAVFLFIIIESIQPDPKGIGLEIVIIITGTVAAFAGTFALFFEFKKESFLYSWASVTGLVNFFLLFQIVRSIICCGIDDTPFFTKLIDLVFLFEASLSVCMLFRFFKKN